MEWSPSGYVALSALNVKNGYIDLRSDVHFADDNLYKKWMLGNELHKGKVIFTTEAPMGNVAQIPDNKKYVLSQRTIAFEINRDIMTDNFLAFLLRSHPIQKRLKMLASGGTAQGVSQRSLAQLNVKIPTNIEEQKNIGVFLTRIDSLITLHQRKIDKIKNMKKVMLDQMFI